MAYAILRTSKLKSFGEIGGSLAHTFRDRETPNADPARLHDNEHGLDTSAAVQAAIKDRLPEKHRSDAVLCIEYLITASPEFFTGRQDGTAYFEAAKAWLVERHGAENVVSTHVHRDETSPHLVAYVVPRDGEKLNAKKFLGGREVLSKMQTDFAEKVGAHLGLVRGLEGSKAQHQTIKDFYAQVQDVERSLDRVQHPTERHVEKGFLTRTEESDPQFAARVAAEVKAQLKPVVVQAAKGAVTEQRAKALQRHNAELQKEVKATKASAEAEIAAVRREAAPWHEALKGLPPAVQEEMARRMTEMAHQMRQHLQKAAEKVIGWIGSLAPAPNSVGQDVFTIERKDTGLRVHLTRTATEDLMRQGAKHRDLVEVNAYGGRIIERRQEQSQSQGMER